MRRLFDILISLVIIIFFIPLCLLIVIYMLLIGERKIFFRQKRIGNNGEFLLIKFNTMLDNSENMPGGLITTKNDPRIIPGLNWLRKTKLNELPQFLNVLNSDLSIVGLRPLPLSYYKELSEQQKSTSDICVKGLTGVASLIFRNEEQLFSNEINLYEFDKNIVVPYKLQLESWYSKDKRLFKYFLIGFLTPVIIFSGSTKMVWKMFYDIPKPPEVLKKHLHG